MQHESQYILSEEYNARTVREFIHNFTSKKLKRSLRTHVYEAPHTHYFGSEGATEQMGISADSVYIEDLTTSSFRKMVRTPGKVSYYYYYMFVWSNCSTKAASLFTLYVELLSRLLWKAKPSQVFYHSILQLNAGIRDLV